MIMGKGFCFKNGYLDLSIITVLDYNFIINYIHNIDGI